MNAKVAYPRITTDADGMELIQYENKDYSFDYYYENIALFDFNCVDWHWHAQLEFVYLESGSVTTWVQDKCFKLTAGSGIFINSGVLHRFVSESDAFVPNFLFLPTFIATGDSLIYRKYVFPIVSSNLTYQVFSPNNPWQERVLTLIKQIAAAQEDDRLRELKTVMLVQKLWLELYENLEIPYTDTAKNPSGITQVRLQSVLSYIHANYMNEISLEDIARQAMLSKSSLLNLFKRNLHITPINYLIEYRLKQAAELLINTEKTVGSISEETGFSTVDYFCKSFKKLYRITPTEYRSEKRHIL